jgi:hypothetical protein
MKRVLALLIAALLIVGFTGCQTDTIIVPEGPAATALGVAKDEQIKGLTAQVKAEQEARLLEQALAAKAASNFLGVLKALDYMDFSPAREAAAEESKLGKQRLGKDDPEETVKALERVVLLVTGQRDEALRRYAEADAATKTARAEIAAKDAEIVKRDETIKARETDIARLAREKLAEQAKHADDIKKALAAKDAEIQRIKDEAASKERAQWVLWTRIAGLGLIVVGVVLLAVFKLVVEGAGLAAGGVIIGLISIFIDWLTNQPWFPYLMGGILLSALVAAYFAIRRLWIKHELDKRKTQAIQDLRDEAAAKGDTKAIDTLDEHLEYRMGKDGSFWQKQQVKTEVALGLIDPKGEAELTAPKS